MSNENKHSAWSTAFAIVGIVWAVAWCSKPIKAEEYVTPYRYNNTYGYCLNTSAAKGCSPVISLNHFSLGYEEFYQRREAYIPEYDGQWESRVYANFEVALLGPIYWKNYIHTETAHSVVKGVGWEWWLGLRVTPWLEVYQHHHSQHVMEASRPTRGGKNVFPVENSYGMTVIFREREGKNTIFK